MHKALLILMFLGNFIFGQSLPKTFGGLELWLRSDSEMVTNANNQVLIWKDLSPNRFDFVPIKTLTSPIVTISSTIINQSVVRFNGDQNDLYSAHVFPIKTIFILLNYAANGSSTFVNQPGFITQEAVDGNKRFFNGATGGNSFFEGICVGNMKINGNTTNSFAPIASMKLLEADLPSVSSFTNLIIGSDFQNANRRWIGDVAEIIFYSTVLDNTQKTQIRNYFYSKYGAKVQLGADRCLKNGEILAPTKTFASYLWSTGATTTGISIQNPGRYWLRATDIFDQVSRDTVEITQVIDLKKPSTDVVCTNDTLTWDTELTAANYSFSWNGGSFGSTTLFNITTTGTYHVKIEELTSGCILNDTLRILSVIGNNLKSNISLGSGDTAVCSGNSIGLTTGKELIKKYSWSNGKITPKIVITSAGIHFLRVKDAAGCSAKDTVNVVSIVGIAPFVSFRYDTLCATQQVRFTNLSTPPPGGLVSKIYWKFDEGSIDSVQANPQITLSGNATLRVQLRAKANNGCFNMVERTLPINPVPIPFIANTDVCNGQTMNFSGSAPINGGTISNWNWNFGAGSSSISTAQNPTFVFTNTGIYPVSLTTISDKSCSNTFTKSVAILQSIKADFSTSSECFNQNVFFRETTTYPSTISGQTRLWDLGRGNFSSSLSPSTNYSISGVYTAQLSVVASNGCKSSITKSVFVKGYPKANFIFEGVCLASKTQLFSTSLAATDTIQSYLWNFGNGNTSRIKNPTFTFKDTTAYQVSLQVTENGCSDDTTISIKIHPTPKADFYFSASEVTPPSVIFPINISSDATSFNWWVNNKILEDSISTIQIPEAGTYSIFLVAANKWNCTDTSTTKIVSANIPDYKVVLNSIFAVKNSTNNAFKINIKVSNQGNRKLDSLEIVVVLSNGLRISEWRKIDLDVSKDTVLAFTSTISNSFSLSNYCVEIKLPKSQVELNLEDNFLCQLLENKLVIKDIFPNPSSDIVSINLSNDELILLVFEWINSQGMTVYKNEKWIEKGVFTEVFSLSFLSNGIYLFQVKNDNRVLKREKILITR